MKSHCEEEEQSKTNQKVKNKTLENMRLSLKLLQQDNHQTQPHHHHAPPLLLRAKIPITIFNLPFLSHFSTTTNRPSDLSLSLSTALPSGPSLKLSYAAAATTTTPPITLTLKSGTGLYGSPNNSPLVISAHFSFNPNNSTNPNPTFSLLVKPQLGSFSLRKSTTSHSESSIASEPTNVVDSGFDSDSNSFGFVPLERPIKIKDVSEAKIDKDSIFKGIKLGAKTVMPVGKRVALNCRWWVNFPKDDMMPVLRINKIGIQRVDDDVLKDNDDDKTKKKSIENVDELEMLKGMCFLMKKELDAFRSVNREIKRDFEEMKMGALYRNGNGNGGVNFKEGVRKKVVNSGGSTGFEDWRSKRNGVKEENRVKEEKNGCSLASDVESELQRAIMAASSSS